MNEREGEERWHLVEDERGQRSVARFPETVYYHGSDIPITFKGWVVPLARLTEVERDRDRFIDLETALVEQHGRVENIERVLKKVETTLVHARSVMKLRMNDDQRRDKIDGPVPFDEDMGLAIQKVNTTLACIRSVIQKGV